MAGCSGRTGQLDDYAKFEAIRNDLSPEVAQMLMSEFAISAESMIQSRIRRIVESQSDGEVIRSVQSFGDGLLEGIRHSGWRLQPVGAAFDSLVFLEQVEGFIRTRKAKVALGPALPAIETLVGDLDDLLRLSVDEFLAEEGVYPEMTQVWVEANPIKEIDLVRPSPIPEVAEEATRQITSAMIAVADVDFTLNSMYNRLNTALAAIPQDVRHQMERAIRSIMRESLVVNALVGFSRLGDGMKETALAISGVDERLGRMQQAILEEVDRQRLETVKLLAEAVALERQAVMADVQAVIQTELSGGISDLGDRTDQVVDRAMFRLERLVLITMVIVILAIASVLVLRARSSHQT
ncbi:MAG: hypothetical protein CMJ23_03015 [Phycisphaerae bacterium]|nr:hypothetical protein [Phycisphaerae bacterium]